VLLSSYISGASILESYWVRHFLLALFRTPDLSLDKELKLRQGRGHPYARVSSKLNIAVKCSESRDQGSWTRFIHTSRRFRTRPSIPRRFSPSCWMFGEEFLLPPSCFERRERSVSLQFATTYPSNVQRGMTYNRTQRKGDTHNTRIRTPNSTSRRITRGPIGTESGHPSYQGQARSDSSR
jgi:hypothetical protein